MNGLTKEKLAYYNERRPLGPQPKLCFAPFKNMYIGHGGNVVACCFNRTYILGTYPEMSLSEIWQGKKAQRLRNAISSNNLNLGCRGCGQQILAGNIDGTKAKQYDELPLNDNDYPSVIEFELSNLCNLECEMCSGDFSSLIRKNRENRPPLQIPYDDAFVSQLDEFLPHLTEVKFYGGEPFLIEIYYQIWERIIEVNPRIRVSIQTNGTILNNRVRNILSKIDFHINISMDSLESENYGRIRKNANLKRVVENTLWFREYTRNRNTFFGISACAMVSNWKELPKFIRFCNGLDAPIYFHNLVYPSHMSIFSMPKETLEEVVDYLESFSFKRIRPIHEKNSNHYRDFILQIRAKLNQLELPRSGPMIQDFSDLLSFMGVKLMEDRSKSDKEKEHTLEVLNEKMKWMEKEINDSIVIRKRLEQIDFTSDILYDNILMYMLEKPKEELKQLFLLES